LDLSSLSGKTHRREENIMDINTHDLPQTRANSIGMEFVLIPAGEFMMGSPQDDPYAQDNEKPQHRVVISQPFYLGKYLVTQAQWQTIMGNNPSHFKGENVPVECVTWDEIQEFIRRLNEGAHQGAHRLPTEAEWEYACRAGTDTLWFCGNDETQLDQYAWYLYSFFDTELKAWYDEDLKNGVKYPPGHVRHLRSRSVVARLEYQTKNNFRVQPVGRKLPNPWGLYDMHGNVTEWTGDLYDEMYYEKCKKEAIVYDPAGPDGPVDSGIQAPPRAGRSGHFMYPACDVRSAIRDRLGTNLPANCLGATGFRLALGL
jgi:formylglycine-generating enzyme required for sulfatase activity